MSTLEERIRQGLTADVTVSADDMLVAAAAGAQRTRRQQRWSVGIGTAAVVLAVIFGIQAATGERTDAPPIERPTPTITTTPQTLPRGPSDALVVDRRADGLDIAGEIVPGRWELSAARRDVWVATRTDANGATSQWWGKGTTAHPMPQSAGGILRGGVVISEDARWIVWTRPADDVSSRNPPRVMEVVDTTSGEVRWSRDADADAIDLGALAVTNDGVVVLAHCLEPVLDSEGWPQCADARVDVWAPAADVVGTVPAEVMVGDAPVPGVIGALEPLVRRTGAHNGLLVQGSQTARPQYVRVGDRGDVEEVATLPPDAVAVTADERFALLSEKCPDGERGCGYSALSLGDGDRRPIPSLRQLLDPVIALHYGFVVERDDLLLVQGPRSGAEAVARCSLAQARCVPIRK